MVDGARTGHPSVLPELNVLLRPDEHAYSGALTDRVFSSAKMHGSPRKPIYSGYEMYHCHAFFASFAKWNTSVPCKYAKKMR
jgi:hypothetical protein